MFPDWGLRGSRGAILGIIMGCLQKNYERRFLPLSPFTRRATGTELLCDGQFAPVLKGACRKLGGLKSGISDSKTQESLLLESL